MYATVFDIHRPAIETINDLELQIVASQADADSYLWQQAALVVAQLKSMTQRALAEQWVNPRTGKPYDHRHVGYVARVFGELAPGQPRPRFRDAYNEMAHRRYVAARAVPEEPKIEAEPVAPPKLARVSVEERRRQCRAMAEGGASIRQIAEALGVGASAINKYAKSGGFEITARRAGNTRRHRPARGIGGHAGGHEARV